jgi:hypothetical protein
MIPFFSFLSSTVVCVALPFACTFSSSHLDIADIALIITVITSRLPTTPASPPSFPHHFPDFALPPPLFGTLLCYMHISKFPAPVEIGSASTFAIAPFTQILLAFLSLFCVIISFLFDLNETVAHNFVCPFAHCLLSRLGLVERNRRSLAPSSPPAPIIHTHSHCPSCSPPFHPSQPIEYAMILQHLSQEQRVEDRLRTDHCPCAMLRSKWGQRTRGDH